VRHSFSVSSYGEALGKPPFIGTAFSSPLYSPLCCDGKAGNLAPGWQFEVCSHAHCRQEEIPGKAFRSIFGP